MRLSFIFFGLIVAGSLVADTWETCCPDNQCCESSCCFEPYASISGGAVFPSRNSSIRGNSTSVLYWPTEVGVSIFDLPNVVWKNAYKTGYELSAVFGFSSCSEWRSEAEFLYQNFRREVSGSYGWRETNASTGLVFAENQGNPIFRISNKTHVYGLLSNLLYDYRACSNLSLSVGGGVGIAWLHSKSTSHDNILHIVTTTPPIDESSPTIEKSPRLYGTAFAWQFKLALSYECWSNFSVSIGYRLFGTTRFQGSTSSITTNPGTEFAARFSMPQRDIRGLLNNSVNAALSYRF